MTERDTQLTCVKFQALIHKTEGYMNIIHMQSFFFPLVYDAKQTFSIPYITCDFVYNQLMHLDISKYTGSDHISDKFLKMAAPIIAPVLTQIFNLRISIAEFPSPFKLARVVPIHKKVPSLTIPTIGQYLHFQLLHLDWNDM